MKLKPKMTQEEWDAMHREVDKTRGKFVRVSKEALSHLLQDQAALWSIVDEENTDD